MSGLVAFSWRSDMLKSSSLLLLLVTLLAYHNAAGQRLKEDPSLMPAFSVSPTEIRITVRPGQTSRGSFLLATKNYKNPQNFVISLLDLGQQSLSGTIPVDIGEGKKSCAQWVDIVGEVTAQGNDRLEIPFSIAVPTGVQGNYFCYIDVCTKPKRPPGSFVVLVKYRLPIRIELSIPGQAQLRLNAKELKYNPGRYKGKPSIDLNIVNEGQWKTSLTGDVLIREAGTGRQTLVEIPYEPNSGKAITIYPGFEIPVTCTLANPLTPGEYVATVRMLMNQFGKSQAHFEFKVGSRGKAESHLVSREEFDLDLSVSPYLIEMPLRPGAIRNIPIRVKNNSDLPLDITVDLKNAVMESNGIFTYTQNDKDDINKQWIQIEPDSLQLQPKRATAVKSKIELPRSSSIDVKSVYVLRINAKRSHNDPGTESAWKSKGEKSVPILLYDAMAKPAHLECSRFDIIQPSKELNPTTGIFRVKNTGGKLAKVRGKMKLENNLGKEYAHMDIGRFQPELIMPDCEREFRFDIPTLDDGEFTLSVDLSFDNQRGKSVLVKEKSFIAAAVKPKGLR